jgi:stage II sporulation SpoAA-like protein
MIEILNTPDHVVAVRLSGRLSGAEMDQLTAAVEARLARHPRIGVVADLTPLTGLTLEALAKDIRYNLSRLGDWKRFPREAVITESAWVQAAVSALDPVLPHVEVRSFGPAEQAAALAWAADFARDG